MPFLISLLATLFVALKLTGYIDWSWWLVLSPLLTYIVYYVGVILLLVIVNVKKEIKMEKMRNKYV